MSRQPLVLPLVASDNSVTMFRTGILCAALLAALPLSAQEKKVELTAEEYLIAARQEGEFVGRNRILWLQLRADPHPNVRFVLGYWTYEQRNVHALDENFVQLDINGSLLKVGRIRAPFGNNSWDEQYYQGFVFMPLMQTIGLSDAKRISRIDTGATAEVRVGPIQFDVSALDVTTDPWQILPDKFDHYSLRAQTLVGPVVVGGNVIVGNRFFDSDAPKAASLDLRFSMPNFQTRAEFLSNSNGKETKGAGYIDGFCKIVGIPQLTLIGRWQFASVLGKSGQSELSTLGFKYQVCRHLAIFGNYSWGPNSTLTTDQIGWAFQAMLSYRF